MVGARVGEVGGVRGMDGSSVDKGASWSVDVERTIAGLREAADRLAAAGVPAQAELTAEKAGDYLHIEARLTYFGDDDDGEPAEPSPALEERV